MRKISLFTKWTIPVVVVAGLGAWFVASAQETDDPFDSLKVCKDTQRLILENQFVRVIDDSIPPGVTEPMHRHRHGVVVYLSDYTTEQTTQDGKKKQSPRRLNTAQWAEATVHSVKNLGSTNSHAIRIELKF